jgi:hypothetical protein
VCVCVCVCVCVARQPANNSGLVFSFILRGPHIDHISYVMPKLISRVASFLIESRSTPGLRGKKSTAL